MRLGQDVRSDGRTARSCEWLIADGIGGSACGTLAALPQRSTHAHLVTCGAHGRALGVLLGMDERVRVGTKTFELEERSTRAHADDLEFRLAPWPTWRYRLDDAILEKSLFLIRGHHSVAIAYRNLSASALELIAAPLFVAPDAPPSSDEAGAPAGELDATLQAVPGRVHIEFAPSRVSLTLWHNGAFMPARARRRYSFPDEADGAAVDTLNVGHVSALLNAGDSVHVIVAAERELFRALAREDRLGAPPPRTLAECVAVLERGEREHRELVHRHGRAQAAVTLRQAFEAHRPAEPALPAETHPEADGGLLADDLPRFDPDEPFLTLGADALDLGLVSRGHRLTLLASLPSGVERGAATLRALHGLVTLRRFDAARDVLAGVIEHLNEGLAPSGFDPDDGTPSYDDPAAALWLAIVGELYVRRSGDREFAGSTLFPALEGVLHYYRSGTALGIRVGPHGLLMSGEGDQAAARSDLNALWYYAQIAIAQLARAAGKKESGAFHLAWAHQHQQRYNELLWDDARGCLRTAVESEEARAAFEPGQLLAVSHPPSLLPAERAVRVVASVEAELFTPHGLRDHPGAAIVRPGWLGTFFTAYLRAHGRSPEAQSRVRAWLEPLREHLAAGISTGLPEGFSLEGAFPQPVGDPLCVLAAAEILRLWVEELDHTPEAAGVS